MVTENEKIVIENSINIIKENLPKIIHKAERQDYKVKKNLMAYIVSTLSQISKIKS